MEEKCSFDNCPIYDGKHSPYYCCHKLGSTTCRAAINFEIKGNAMHANKISSTISDLNGTLFDLNNTNVVLSEIQGKILEKEIAEVQNGRD